MKVANKNLKSWGNLLRTRRHVDSDVRHRWSSSDNEHRDEEVRWDLLRKDCRQESVQVVSSSAVTILFFWSQMWSYIWTRGWSWGGHKLYRLNWTIIYKNKHHAALKKTYCKLDFDERTAVQSCGNPRSYPLCVLFMCPESFDIKWRRRGCDTNDKVLQY